MCNKKGYHWFVVATVCIGAFMAALDSSIVNIALPVMKRDFHTHMRIIEWVSLTYLLTLAAFIVPLSRLSDMFGRRWMYSFGFFVFIVGSFLCGFAPSLRVLFVARSLQAVGASMLQANSVSIITASTPANDRGKAIGIQASAQGIGLSLGPLIGGALITLLGWRWIFYVNVPVGVIGTILGILMLPAGEEHKEHEKFDLFGSLILAPILVAVIYVLNVGEQVGWAAPISITCYGVIMFGLVGFVLNEGHVQYPLIDLSLFRNRTFIYGNTVVTLSFAVMYGVMFLAPFYLDNVHKVSALNSGLFLMVIPIGMAVLTPISGIITDKLDAKLSIVAGASIIVIGAVILSVFTEKYIAAVFAVGLFFIGCGMGMFTPANNSNVMASVPHDRLSIGGGMLNMSRTLGMGLGVALGGLTYQLFLRTYGVVIENSATVVQMIPAFRDSFIVLAVLTGVIVVLVSITSRQQGTTQ